MIQTLADGLGPAGPGPGRPLRQQRPAGGGPDPAGLPGDAGRPGGPALPELITFHDGFSYFADAFDLTILRAIEEEAGGEASAREVADIVTEIQTHQLPAIFTEVNGADATAQIIHRECGVPVYALTLMMSAGTAYEEPGVATYLNLLQSNLDTLREAYL